MYWIAVWKPTGQLMEVLFSEAEIAPWLAHYRKADQLLILVKKVAK